MSKSFGNCIFINDEPNDVFGKTMSISDDLMKEWWPIFFEESIAIEMKPMILKKKLAFEVTKQIWSLEEAEKAQKHFEDTVQNKKITEDTPVIFSTHIVNAILLIRKCSISEAKRLIKQGAVRVNNEKINDERLEVKKGDVVRVGRLDAAKVE
jgi:tyrosyl-tRNA synthetase